MAQLVMTLEKSFVSLYSDSQKQSVQPVPICYFKTFLKKLSESYQCCPSTYRKDSAYHQYVIQHHVIGLHFNCPNPCDVS